VWVKPLEEREAGKTVDVVKRRLAAVITVPMDIASAKLWWRMNQFGPWRPKRPALDAARKKCMLYCVRSWLRLRLMRTASISCGGSMNAANAQQLLAQKTVSIDGGLVGSASLESGRL